MIKFKLNKEKSNDKFEFIECTKGDSTITIIKSKNTDTYGVFVRRYVYDDTHLNLGYIEIANHLPKTYTESKQVAEKMIDIVNGYKPPLPN